jgi:hypothetical protein
MRGDGDVLGHGDNDAVPAGGAVEALHRGLPVALGSAARVSRPNLSKTFKTWSCDGGLVHFASTP